LLQTTLEVYLCPSDASRDNLIRGGFGQIAHNGRHMRGDAGAPGSYRVAKSNYVGSCGYGDVCRTNIRAQNGMFHRRWAYGLRDILDGASNTILVGERSTFCGGGAWCGNRNPTGCGPRGADYTLGRTSMPINWQNNNAHWCMEGFASEHVGGAQFLMGDGRVVLLSENIDYHLHRNANDPIRDQANPNRTGWRTDIPGDWNFVLGIYQRLGQRNDGVSTGNF
jgi:hypothetical protein